MASVQMALEALQNRKDQVNLELGKSEKTVRLPELQRSFAGWNSSLTPVWAAV